MAEPNVLGEFLRGRRGRLQPEAVGLPGTLGRRRTPGLRREEVATLAGVSVDYYIRLEQGKERNPAGAVVEALADALQLDAEERSHLRTLAALTAGRVRRDALGVAPKLGADVGQLLDHLKPWPALVLSRISDVLASNSEGLALLAGLGNWPASRRNTLRHVFTHPDAMTLFDDWEHAAATGVADLRSWLATDPDGTDLIALRDELGAASADFERLWAQHDVRLRRSAVKVFHHPEVGTLALMHSTMRLQDGETRLSLYRPAPNSPDLEALKLLGMTAQFTDGQQ